MNDKVIIVTLPKSNEHKAQAALGTLPLFKVRAKYLPFVDEVVYVKALNARDAEATARAYLVVNKSVPRSSTALTSGWEFCAFTVEEENL